MLSDEASVIKFRFDTAENEPTKKLKKFVMYLAKFANFANFAN